MSREGLRLSSIPYTSLPPNPYQRNVVVLPVDYHLPSKHDRCLRRGVTFAGILLLLSAAVLFLYPSDPSLKLARIRLNHVGVKSSPKLTLDLSFSLTVLVRNRDFFSLDYKKLVVSVGYRGNELGVVNSEGGHLEARGSSYVNATLDLNGFEVVHDVVYLIQDWAKGLIPFDTTTKVDGVLGVFPFKFPFKAKVSNRVFVNTKNQTIVHQDCC
ncbi:hypothetical protein like AT4G13270 [Hibiscus trionum]|uniref:Late embryogenesis abundant protein LEA-2 subgroup domain-containing protein n=1 Tax=Hibiscus trionum TaxID=183268 RepID=A0A9W7I5X7_HIBTR|nr:hypothetical protein like AT4G13270 [Hibiscus trionum]